MQSDQPNFNLNNSRLRLVSGTSNPNLANEIATYLGIKNVPLISKRFRVTNFLLIFKIINFYICRMH